MKGKHIYFSRNGGVLEVRLQDSAFNTYFKTKVDITNKKQIRELIKELRNKGVDFPSRIL